MTAPIAHGYPDFGRYVARAAKLFTRVTGFPLDGTVSHGAHFVGDISHLGISYGGLSCPSKVTVSWYQDAALTVLFTSQTYGIEPTGVMNTSIPIAGPYVVVTVAPISGTGTYSLILFETSYAAPSIGPGPDDCILTWGNNVSIAATATSTFSVLNNWPGLAVFTMNTDAVAWFAKLYATDNLGNQKTVARWASGFGYPHGVVMLPSSRVSLDLHNSDATAKPFFWALVAQPYPW